MVTQEAPLTGRDKKVEPWQRIIICGPGDSEEIKKAGKDARDEEGEIVKDVTVKINKTNESKK